VAISKGTSTTNVTTPGSTTTFSFNHTQDVGDDRVLVVAVVSNGADAISGVEYNGVALTERLNYTGSSVLTYGFWELKDPAEGTNAVTVTMGANAWNPIGTVAQSFTGADTGGNVGNNADAQNPHSRTLAVSANSLIMQMAVSTANVNIGNWTVNGVTTPRVTLAVNRYVSVGTSETPLPASTITCVTLSSTSWHSLTNQRLEVKAATTSRRIFVIT
jgi:hypothetical protein